MKFPSANYFCRSQCPLRTFVCWDCGFESRRGNGHLYLVSVERCQVEVTASGWSLVQRIPAECGVSECDREALTTRRLWPIWDCCAMQKKMFLTNNISVSYLLCVRQLTFLYSIVTSSHWPMSSGNSVTCVRTSVIAYIPIYHWYLPSRSQLYIHISYKIVKPMKR